MNKKRITVLMIFVLLIGIAYYFFTRNPTFPTDKIESMIRKTAEAVERESILSFQNFIAQDFHSNRAHDRSMLLSHVQYFFRESDQISVQFKLFLHENAELPADAEEARVIVVAIVSGKTDGNAFQGVTGQGVDTFLIGVKKYNGRWKINYAQTLSPTELQYYKDNPDEL